MTFNFILEKFINKHKKIHEIEKLKQYISFLLSYNINEEFSEDDYYENHHILPVCKFPEYRDESWNLVRLKYEDHKKAHLLLFKSINIRPYQRPLNFMMPYYKDKKRVSNAAKIGWENLKKNTEVYNKWREAKSNYMKNLHSSEQSRRAKIFWENISEDEYLDFCKKMKDVWTIKMRKMQSERLKEYYKNPDNREKKSKETKMRWDSMSKSKRLEFSNKLDIINKDINKRLDAGKKIKYLWSKEEFRTKMMNRKSRRGNKYKIISPNNNEIIINTLTKVSEIYDISQYKVRKYAKLSTPILEKDLKSNKSLLGCIIKKIN